MIFSKLLKIVMKKEILNIIIGFIEQGLVFIEIIKYSQRSP